MEKAATAEQNKNGATTNQARAEVMDNASKLIAAGGFKGDTMGAIKAGAAQYRKERNETLANFGSKVGGEVMASNSDARKASNEAISKIPADQRESVISKAAHSFDRVEVKTLQKP